MTTLTKDRFFPLTARFTSMAVLCVSCAAQNGSLQQARQTYAQARQDPAIAANAPVALHEAEEALRKAEQAKDREDVKTFAYVVQKKIKIARAEAERKIAEDKAQQLLKERDQVLVQKLQRELAELKAEKTQRGYVMTLGNVLFDYNKASLNPGAQQTLYRLVTFLKEHPKRNVLIEGYTDSRGSESYNLDLSERRAQTVQDFLLENGVTPERIGAHGYGKAYPVASNATEAGRLQNRRVEVVISEEGKPAVERE